MLAKSDLSQIRGAIQEEVSSLAHDVSAMRKDVAQIKKDIRKIQKDVSAHANYFDKEYLELRGRVKTIEGRIGVNSLF